jgi:hypothetical protein
VSPARLVSGVSASRVSIQREPEVVGAHSPSISNKSPENVSLLGGALNVGLFEDIMIRTKNIKQ